MKAVGLVLLLGFCCGVSSVIHSMKYFSTASSGLSSFPEYVEVGMVDEVQMVHYDSNSMRSVPKQAWMEQATRDEPDYWERNTGIAQSNQQVNKVRIETGKKRFNQTGGAHIVQWMFGCEWDDEDDTTDGYNQYGYDGEDFLSLDLKTLTWIAPVPQAVTSKQRWDQDRAYNEQKKNYLTKVCVDWLKKHLAYGKSTLQRTGTHIVQWMYGCEWDDEDDTTDGYNQFGYDGEDFISLDLKTLTWIAPVPQAVPTKRKWDQNRAYNENTKNYFTKECVDWLKKHLANGKSTLQRTGTDTSSNNTEEQRHLPEAQPLTSRGQS